MPDYTVEIVPGPSYPLELVENTIEATISTGTPGESDHGSLAGLGDDDHPQYVHSAPSGALRNAITPLTDVPGIVVRQWAGSLSSAGQAKPLFAVQDPSGNSTYLQVTLTDSANPRVEVTTTLHVRDDGGVKLYEQTINGTSGILIKAPSSLSADWTLTLPTSKGSNGQYLKTDGNGNTSWSNVAASETPTLQYANSSVPSGNTVADTTNETSFSSSYTGPSFANATVYRVTAHGVVSASSAGSPTLTLRMRINGTLIFSSPAMQFTADKTNSPWKAETLIIVRSVGASGLIESQGDLNVAGLFLSPAANLAEISINTTTTQTFQLSAQWNLADPANSVTLRSFVIEKV